MCSFIIVADIVTNIINCKFIMIFKIDEDENYFSQATHWNPVLNNSYLRYVVIFVIRDNTNLLAANDSHVLSRATP